jgi:hypothetical protein
VGSAAATLAARLAPIPASRAVQQLPLAGLLGVAPAWTSTLRQPDRQPTPAGARPASPHRLARPTPAGIDDATAPLPLLLADAGTASPSSPSAWLPSCSPYTAAQPRSIPLTSCARPVAMPPLLPPPAASACTSAYAKPAPTSFTTGSWSPGSGGVATTSKSGRRSPRSRGGGTIVDTPWFHRFE